MDELLNASNRIERNDGKNSKSMSICTAPALSMVKVLLSDNVMMEERINQEQALYPRK